MTSTANASSSGISTAKQHSQSSTTPRTTMKAATPAKGSDGMRKQTASPADGTSRPPPKAWGSGTNPITQKSTTPVQTNGTAAPHRSAQQNSSKESNTADQHAHDRLIFICAASIGMSVTLTSKSGDVFTGIMSSPVLNPGDLSITLKMVQQQSSTDAQTNGISMQPFIGSGENHAMTFDLRDMGDLLISGLSFADIKPVQNGTPSGFRTDTDISGNRDILERKLQKWVPDESIGPDMSLESSTAGGWDQFETNERKFGTKSTYDESLYTTAINKKDPSYKQREAAAARLAREIEGSVSENTHIREERGQALEADGDDEEAKYSGVIREAEFPPMSSGQLNKYTPPARRAPTSQPTVPGAPFDPAIISAQLSKPDTPARQPKAETKPIESTTAETPAGTKTITENPTKPSVAEKLAPEQPKTRTLNASVSPQRNENATEGVEKELLTQFRNFAVQEKAKVQERVQERRRNQANHDRTAKLNELLRFSKTFKLNTPVPKDLVPILAKDPAKQEEIIEKAQRQTDDKKKTPTVTPSAPVATTIPATAATTPAIVNAAAVSTTASPATATQEVRTPSRPAAAGRFEGGAAPPVHAGDRQNAPRGRQGYPPTGPQASQQNRLSQQPMPARGPAGYMNRMSAKVNMPPPMPAPIPLDARMPSGQPLPASGLSSPQRSAMQTPNSAMSTRFNVGAMEFRPNPSASSFKPTGGSSVAASSPQSTTTRTRSVSRAPSPTTFFGTRKPIPASERPKFSSFFNPVKRMKKESEGQPVGKNYASNGGIPEPYRTQVRWDVPEANNEKTYRDMVDKAIPPPMSPSNRSMSSSSHLPHQHQLPAYLQNGGPGVAHTPPQGPHAMQAQHSHQSHFDDHHRMQGPPAHAYHSPRINPAPVMYQTPMAAQPQMYGQPNAQYFPQGQMPMQMRFPAQQFVQPQAVPMMTQHSQPGHYMAVPQQFTPQMPMFSPSPGHAYPAHVAQQAHSGFPSPGRGAPMMMHQGSQQGHHPQGMYLGAGQPGQAMYNPQQPHMHNMRPGYPTPSAQYATPHQPHPFPPQPPRAPSNGYVPNQTPQKVPQHMVPQPQAPPPIPANFSGDHVAEDSTK